MVTKQWQMNKIYNQSSTRHGKRRRRRKQSRKMLLGSIVFEVVLPICCVFVGLHLFQQMQPVDALETIPHETIPSVTIPILETETMESSTGLNLSWTERAIQTFAGEHGLSMSDYPEDLVAMLERNPETEEFVLNYPLEYGKNHEVDLSEYIGSETVPLLMQWDKRWGYLDYAGEVVGLSGCGPVCLSMVVCYLTGDYSVSPDKVIQYAIDNGYSCDGSGSFWTLISDGGSYYGLDVTEFAADKGRILANLEVGNPIICIMGPGDFTSSGHFVVLTGLENGLIRVNDPNSFANSQKLWDYDSIEDQILDVWVLRNLG